MPPSLPLYPIYQLKSDTASLQGMEAASRDSSPTGLKPTHGLVGTTEWWENIASGHLPVITVRGRVSRFWRGHHDDYPEFELLEDSGGRSMWGCEIPAARAEFRFAIGTTIEVDYVRQDLKSPFNGSTASNVVIEIRGA